jgi:transposase
VPIKLVESQGLLALHRARKAFIKERTALANQLRAFWSSLAS